MCQGCPSIVRANENGAGVGEHADSCLKEVKFRCACGYNFRGNYSGVKSLLSAHLKNECTSVLTANTRRLTRTVNRFEELKIHPLLIKFYKDQEPFYWLDPDDELDEKFALPQNYVSNLDHLTASYEGEVDVSGKWYGRGIAVKEVGYGMSIFEGFFTGFKLNGLGRKLTFAKESE